MWEILRQAGIDPAPDRASTTWASFLRSQANALLACDFFETSTVTGARLFVLALIEHGTRRIRVLGATPHPTASWVVQAARNLVMDLEDADCRARFLIRDRDGKYPALFDAVLKDAGVEVVLSGVQMPRMNAVMERWVLTCRRELLTGPWSGTSGTCCTPCASSSSSITAAGRTRGSRTPGHCAHCPHQFPRRTSTPAPTSSVGATASAASSTSTSMPPNLHG